MNCFKKSNYYILSVKTNTKELYFQLQKLLTDKRLDHEKMCAPSYANIFMNHFERKFMYSFIKTFSCSYLRFIDDKFFTWTGSKTDLENFLNGFNTKHPSVKVKYKISKQRISFQDTEIYIKNNKLLTKIFRKVTDR